MVSFGEMSRRGRPRAQGPGPPSLGRRRGLGVGGGGFLDREMPKMSVKDQLSEQRTGERPFLTKET